MNFDKLTYDQTMILAEAWTEFSAEDRAAAARSLGATEEYLRRILGQYRNLEEKRRQQQHKWLADLLSTPSAPDTDATMPLERATRPLEAPEAPEPVQTPIVAQIAPQTTPGIIRVLPTVKEAPPADLRDKWGRTFVYGTEREPSAYAVPLYTGHQVRHYDRVLVLNDLHIPALDLDFLEDYAIPTALHYGIKDCVIAGDFWDGASISRHPKKRVYPFGREVEYGADVLEFLCRHFRVFLEPGNHDDWFIFENGGHIQFRQAVEMMVRRDAVRTRLEVTEYDRVTIYNAGHKWTVPHQANYSRQALKVGSDLAQKYQSNVIVPHQHINGKGPDLYNRYTVIDCGGMFDPRKLDYCNLKTSTGREMNQGFVTLVDGWAELWTPNPVLTDWSRVGLEPPDRPAFTVIPREAVAA